MSFFKSSNDELLDLTLKRAPAETGFSLIVAFDFYDGPERGFAMYPSGTAVRFNTLGDSASRLFRSYELVSAAGYWSEKVATLAKTLPEISSRRVILPNKQTKELLDFENLIYDAESVGQYVGVGSPWLDKLRIAPASERQILDLRRFEGSTDGFRAAHSFVKFSSQTT